MTATEPPRYQPDLSQSDPQWKTIKNEFGVEPTVYGDFTHNPSTGTYSCLHKPDGELISGGTFAVFRYRLISFDAEHYPCEDDYSDLLGPNDDADKLMAQAPPHLAEQINWYWPEWRAAVLAYQELGYDFALAIDDPEPWQATHERTGEVIKASTYLQFKERFDAFDREHGGV